ncbi:MAG: phosphoribosyltransferase family protein [Acidimicrobiia bacterium]
MSDPPAASARVLLDRAALRTVVERLARAIEADFPDGVVLVAVLKGALLFCADLARAITATDVLVDFLSISRYAPDSGRVRIVQDVALDLTGRDVVLVEDLVDTGLTLAYLVQYVEGLGPRRVEVCTLLDRPARRIVPVRPRYVGAEIEDVFVLGGGLHHDDRYRNLPMVLDADRAVVTADPDAYLGWYARPEERMQPGGTLAAESEATA